MARPVAMLEARAEQSALLVSLAESRPRRLARRRRGRPCRMVGARGKAQRSFIIPFFTRSRGS